MHPTHETWTWDDIYLALSRERSTLAAVELGLDEVECHPSEVGASTPGGTRWNIDVTDGSTLVVDERGGHLHVQLRPAPLPMATWLGETPRLALIAMPSLVVVLAVVLSRLA